LFHIAFNGSNYHGWQIQNNAVTVQDTIEKSFNLLLNLNEKINIVGCGRTDKGVHASQFFFHTDLPETSDDFHARFSAVSRTYEYKITQLKEPFQNDFFTFEKNDLDIELMNKSCEKLMSYKDFTSFSKVHTDVNNFNCNVTKAFWIQKNHHIIFRITANRFLRNMVRAVVGTMLLVGQKKLSILDFCKIIESKDRSSAGSSVKAKGLFLVNVDYKNEE
jgi:tRNA pseudouridine38-40 synthase